MELTQEKRREFDTMTDVALRQLKESTHAKHDRMARISEFEKDYNNVMRPVLPGRYYIPVPVMGGFVDTLLSKIDDPVSIEFDYTDLTDLKAAQFSTALLKRDADDAHGKWNRKDRLIKKAAIFSGVGISEYHASSANGQYKSVWRPVDYRYFHCETQAGSDLEDHAFCGEECIFKTKSDLEYGIENLGYDSENVKAIMNYQETNQKEVENKFQKQQERLEFLNLKPLADNYLGEPVFNTAQWEMTYKGKRWLLWFDITSRKWLKVQELKKVFTTDLYSYNRWATHADHNNFWSKGPCDDVWPISECIKELVSQTMYNMKKRNEPQRAYDPNIYPNPFELDYRPNGLVTAESKGGTVNIANGIYSFNTPDTSNITINLAQFLDNYLGQKTGITPSSQGKSDDQTNGIYYGNLQQVADRLGLNSKNYTEFWADLGVRYLEGLRHVRGQHAVKLLGIAKGSYWKDIKRVDLKHNRDFEIKVVASSAEVEASENKKKARRMSLDSIMRNSNLMKEVNPKWLVAETLRSGTFEDDDISKAFSKEDYHDQELISEALQACEDIVNGEKPKKNRGATTAFIQAIVDFASKDEDMEDETHKALMEYANDHFEIAEENMGRQAYAKIKLQQAQAPIPPQAPNQSLQGGAPAQASMPIPNQLNQNNEEQQPAIPIESIG